MKILTSDEIELQKYHTIKGGIVGAVGGLAVSGLMFRFLPRRYPKFNLKTMPWSVKTALFIMPPTVLTVICAEESSNKFDAMMYSSDYRSDRLLEEHKEWAQKSIKEKIISSLSNNKYKIITGIWAASLYASWEIINRDKIMTTTQKAVQARMYAQFITVVLLLASVALSQYESKLQPNKFKLLEQNRWENALKAAAEEEEEMQRQKTRSALNSNEERKKAKIFKYD
ncbi:hypothetical protein KAFR_0F00810 [Kazachstania africana CBS 2517]|uniref:HIG1 domain-containing protein n=1 Tax=Kazachstania africana (strain ATCC 22294 / BCRC 22015 / CBS 2517 / CECT 1963 / NBRC 1671 / NRRL Y-8276) TaxID=1071382 RepID=H2AWC8_KAZAF|nr:hypothetical protein KAFR_0F00810 [Kazachstania africana CBS 2517]CCF58678.1 hypothetical protein KAFR_0F00810 [Kazachstania africana CBS 2517]